MESVKTKIKAVFANKTYVAIKDTHTTNIQGKPTTQTKYRVVDNDTYKRLLKGVKFRKNKDTGRYEEVEDTNPHKVQELGHASTKEEAKQFIPTKQKTNN